MTREDVIRMAREAGIGPVYGYESIEHFFQSAYAAGAAAERKAVMQLFTDPENQPTQHGTVTVEYMQREIAAEREACAKVCDEQGKGRKALEHYAALTYSGAAHDCAAAIRARGQA